MHQIHPIYSIKIIFKSNRGVSDQGFMTKREKFNDKEPILLIPIDTPWYDIKTCIEVLPLPSSFSSNSDSNIDSSFTKVDNSQFVDRASLLYNQKCEEFKSSNYSFADLEWKKNLKFNGTLSDKCASAILICQEAPFYQGIESIKDLMAIATKDSRHSAVPAFEALTEIFCRCNLFPPSRPLFGWRQIRIIQKDEKKETNNNELDATLVIMHFETALRRELQNFLKLIEIFLQDQLDFVRVRALKTLYQLLETTPTFRSAMLSLLCSRFGDANRKLASRVIHYLELLIELWKGDCDLIIVELEKLFLDRKDLSEKAKYYSTTFLSQIKISPEQPKLAEKLVKIYTSLFKQELGSLNSSSSSSSGSFSNSPIYFSSIEKILNNRVTRAISSGLARAMPHFRGKEDPQLTKDLVEPFRRILKGTSSSSTKIQSLLLLYNLDKSEKFYESLIETLNDFDTRQSGCHSKLFSMLYIVIKNDKLITVMRMKKIIKTLLKLTLKQGIQKIEFTMAVILFINEACRLEPDLSSLIFPQSKMGKAIKNNKKLEPLSKKSKINRENQKEKSAKESKTEEEKENKENKMEISNKENDQFWELTVLKNHYHPMIANATRELLSGSRLPAKYMIKPFEVLNMMLFLEGLESVKLNDLIDNK